MGAGGAAMEARGFVSLREALARCQMRALRRARGER